MLQIFKIMAQMYFIYHLIADNEDLSIMDLPVAK